jgi:hypothetical protein
LGVNVKHRKELKTIKAKTYLNIDTKKAKT